MMGSVSVTRSSGRTSVRRDDFATWIWTWIWTWTWTWQRIAASRHLVWPGTGRGVCEWIGSTLEVHLDLGLGLGVGSGSESGSGVWVWIWIWIWVGSGSGLI
jgi:hypothetical protein